MVPMSFERNHFSSLSQSIGFLERAWKLQDCLCLQHQDYNVPLSSAGFQELGTGNIKGRIALFVQHYCDLSGYNDSHTFSFVLSNRSESFSSLEQKASLHNRGLLLAQEEGLISKNSSGQSPLTMLFVTLLTFCVAAFISYPQFGTVR